MTRPVPTRFSDAEIAVLDELVEQGIGDNRSDVIRRAVSALAATVRRARVGAAIADSYRTIPRSTDDDDLAMANALALTEAEAW